MTPAPPELTAEVREAIASDPDLRRYREEQAAEAAAHAEASAPQNRPPKPSEGVGTDPHVLLWVMEKEVLHPAGDHWGEEASWVRGAKVRVPVIGPYGLLTALRNWLVEEFAATQRPDQRWPSAYSLLKAFLGKRYASSWPDRARAKDREERLADERLKGPDFEAAWVAKHPEPELSCDQRTLDWLLARIESIAEEVRRG